MLYENKNAESEGVWEYAFWAFEGTTCTSKSVSMVLSRKLIVGMSTLGRGQMQFLYGAVVR